MSSINFEYSHNLEKQKAQKQAEIFIKQLLNSYKHSFQQPSITWNKSKDKINYSFTAYACEIYGTLKLLKNKVKLDVNVPFFLMPFSEHFKQRAKEKIDVFLNN